MTNINDDECRRCTVLPEEDISHLFKDVISHISKRLTKYKKYDLEFSYSIDTNYDLSVTKEEMQIIIKFTLIYLRLIVNEECKQIHMSVLSSFRKLITIILRANQLGITTDMKNSKELIDLILENITCWSTRSYQVYFYIKLLQECGQLQELYKYIVEKIFEILAKFIISMNDCGRQSMSAIDNDIILSFVEIIINLHSKVRLNNSEWENPEAFQKVIKSLKSFTSNQVVNSALENCLWFLPIRNNE